VDKVSKIILEDLNTGLKPGYIDNCYLPFDSVNMAFIISHIENVHIDVCCLTVIHQFFNSL